MRSVAKHRWKLDLESSGDFSVASVRKIIDDKSLSDVDSKTRWIKYVPIKVNIHAWKVKIDSLPTKMVVKEIVSRLLEEEEKLEWWFEQDIDKEEVRFEGDDDGDEVRKLGD
ncbi:hypothetical protein Tco_0789179 [Tanacetum coccineum]